jgi:hypothetical protein
MNTRSSIAATLLVLVLSACAEQLPPGGDPEPGPGPPGYEEHLARWTDQGVATYSFSLYLGSFEGPAGPFCGEAEVRIGVENGLPSSVRERFGCVVDPADPALGWVPFTIDELFDLIKENGIHAEYDEALGYPRAIMSEGRLRHSGEVVFPVESSGFEVFVNDLEPGSADVGSADEVLAALAEQRLLWQSHAIDTYRLSIERICFCPPGSYSAVVEAGRVVSVMVEDGASVPLDAEELNGFPLTVSDLFGEIERWANADSIEVEYDGEFGYPTRISVDPISHAIDDEVAFVVTRFRVG